MDTINDKMTYLSDTKEQIRQALNIKISEMEGEGITTEDTFRSYVDKINGLSIGIDTSDADAVARDIVKDKTAYVNGEKIVGTLESGTYNTILDKSKIPTTREASGDDNVLRNSITTIPMFDTSNWKTCYSLFSNWGGLTSIPLLNTSNATSMVNMFVNCTSLTTIPLLDTSSVTSMGYMFQGCTSLETIPLLNTSNVTDMGYMFQGCTSLETIPLLNTSNVTGMSSMFINCTSLETIPLLDTSSATSTGAMFSSCVSLTAIPLLDTSNVTNMTNMFYKCTSLTTIPLLDTSNATRTYGMFNGCTSLETIPSLDMSKVTDLANMFSNCTGLISIGGLQNLGKAYTQKTANYSNYKLILDTSTQLTHDSLMNVINNLYDLNLSYNVEGGGTLYKQQLKLGATNLAKLTEEEIAIATNKGWNVIA